MSQKLQSLLLGLNAFKEGMQQFATSKAINDSKKELDAARLTFAQAEGLTPDQVGMDSKGFDDKKNQIAQDLSMRLAQTGASATQIAAATGFGLNAAQVQERQTAQMATGAKMLEAQMKSQEKNVKESRKLAIDAPDKFFAASAPKKLIDGITSVDNMINQLETNPGAAPVTELAKSSLIKAVEGGKVTDADIERMAINPSYRGKILRRIGIEMKDAVSMEETAFFKQLAEKIRDKSVTQLRDMTDAQIKSLGAAAPELEQERVKGAFNERLTPFKTTGEIMKARAEQADRKLLEEQIKAGKISPERADKLLQAIEQKRKMQQN